MGSLLFVVMDNSIFVEWYFYSTYVLVYVIVRIHVCGYAFRL